MSNHGSQQIGFTDDGLVFFRATLQDPDGRPFEATFSWTPKDALTIARLILENASKCAKANKSHIVIPGA